MPSALGARPHIAQPMKTALERLYSQYDRVDSAADPVHIVHRYPHPRDREVAGFCAAALAFGRVASVVSSVGELLGRMGRSPADYVGSFVPNRDDAIEELGHRWARGVDLVALLWILRGMIRSAGSIEGFFREGYDPSAIHTGPALESFSTRAMAMDLTPVYGHRPARMGVRYFFPRPSNGSGCKRLNLYLRWMVRRDAIDMGIWSGIPRSKLVIPLDAHIVRLGQCLRLTRYRSPGWRMAEEITTSLRSLDPADPVKYDFALCHLGMVNACGFSRPQRDAHCPLRGVCRPIARRHRAYRRPSVRH